MQGRRQPRSFLLIRATVALALAAACNSLPAYNPDGGETGGSGGAHGGAGGKGGGGAGGHAGSGGAGGMSTGSGGAGGMSTGSGGAGGMSTGSGGAGGMSIGSGGAAGTGTGGSGTGGNGTGGSGTGGTGTGGTGTGGGGAGGMGGSGTGGAAGCTDPTSPNTCGSACVKCTAPTGGTPTCVSGACDFTCGSQKKCPGGTTCIASTGCCSNTDCPMMASGQTGTCDSGTHTCSYACPSTMQACTIGGTTTCIALGGCCTNSDCTGTCQTCNSSHACVAAVSQDDPNGRCAGTCDSTGACKSKKGQACTATTGGCITGSTCTNSYCCTASCGTDAKCGGTCAGSSTGTCTYPSNTTSCDDGLWCNGTDTCNGSGTCNHQFASGNRCTGTDLCDLQTCSESNQTCFKSASTQCGIRTAITCADTTSCGGQPQSQTFTRNCSGTASACPATEVAGTLTPLTKCASSQLCSGAGSCSTDIGCQPTAAWCDPNTGLCWQTNHSTAAVSWMDATTYCQNLVQGGRSDWRLPTIAEFFAVYRGCSNGSNAVVTAVSPCRLSSVNDPTPIQCAACPQGGGPDKVNGGCYWAPNTVPTACNSTFGPWSSDQLSDGSTAWQAIPESGTAQATMDDNYAEGVAICVLNR